MVTVAEMRFEKSVLCILCVRAKSRREKTLASCQNVLCVVLKRANTIIRIGVCIREDPL